MLSMPEAASAPLTAVFAAVVTVAITWAVVGGPGAAPRPAQDAADVGWIVPDVDALPDDDLGQKIRYGRTLIARTYAVIGPEVAEPTHRYAGNNLACQSCHIKAATARFALPFQGVFAAYPLYRVRSGAIGTIEDRINECMTRSMNGTALPIGGPEMGAMVAYLKFMSDALPPGAAMPGRGSGTMPELDRAANPANGKRIYAQTCAVCHGPNGEGRRLGVVGDAKGYAFPPLWGDDSYNDGAGMARLIGAANFVHANMPDGTTWRNPVLVAKNAWDVAAYVLAQPRPHKADIAHDYPKPWERPADSNYGPYPDGFSEAQHKLGPFGPIRTAIGRLKP